MAGRTIVPISTAGGVAGPEKREGGHGGRGGREGREGGHWGKNALTAGREKFLGGRQLRGCNSNCWSLWWNEPDWQTASAVCTVGKEGRGEEGGARGGRGGAKMAEQERRVLLSIEPKGEEGKERRKRKEKKEGEKERR